MREKKHEPEFTVTDRRKFTESGELRPDSEKPGAEQRAPEPEMKDTQDQAPESEARLIATVEKPPVAAPADSTNPARVEHLREAPPATPAEHEAQGREYDAGNKRLDDILREKTGGPARWPAAQTPPGAGTRNAAHWRPECRARRHRQARW